MSQQPEPPVLQAILDGWDRHNRVLMNLAGAIPEGGFSARALPGSPSVGEMFSHMHHERMVSVAEEAPEHAGPVPDGEWLPAASAETIVGMLKESGQVVRGGVQGRVAEGRPLDLHFSHPVVLLQFLIFHEGYHHGQIKLALKAAGKPISDDRAGPLTWDVWRGREPNHHEQGGTTMRIEIETTVDAPIERVWKAYVEPEHIVRWNAASDDWHSPRSTVDLRKGGRFSSRMEARDGSMGFDFEGTYTAVEPHERIEYRMDDDRTVEVRFEETDRGVRVLTAFDAEGENPVEMQRDGWQAILDNFRRYVEGMG